MKKIEDFFKTAGNADFKKFKEIISQYDVENNTFFELKRTLKTFVRVQFEEDRLLTLMGELHNLICSSDCTRFSDFIDDLKSNHADLYCFYQTLEACFYPELGLDHDMIFKALGSNEKITAVIPPQYRDYVKAIASVRGSPFASLFSTTLAYAVGFSPYVLGNIVASQLHNTSAFARLMLSAAPTGIGGFARFWVANQVDSGDGKKAVITLLLTGICGFLGLLCLISTIDLSSVKTADKMYWAVFACNVLSGAGVANYSASLPMSAQAAPNDSPALWENKLHQIGVTNIGFFEKLFANLIRQGPKEYIAIVAGIGSLSPSITLFIAAFVLPYIGLRGVYAIFGSITIIGMLMTATLLQNSVLDQLRYQQVPDKQAKEIAAWMGQKLQSSPEMTLTQRIKRLNKQQIQALILACFNYITTFGVLLAITSTGTLILSQRGINPRIATFYTASISGLSSLTRALMAFFKLPYKSSNVTNFAFVVMMISSATFAFSSQRSIWLPMLMIFSVANGIGNYGVFAQVADTLSEVIGLASGLSGAAGAVSAFFICIAFASLTATNQTTEASSAGASQTHTAYEYLLATGFCGLSLFSNIAHEHKRSKTIACESFIVNSN